MDIFTNTANYVNKKLLFGYFEFKWINRYRNETDTCAFTLVMLVEISYYLYNFGIDYHFSWVKLLFLIFFFIFSQQITNKIVDWCFESKFEESKPCFYLLCLI